MFLLPDINTRLRPTLLALEPGTRIVSSTWDMGGSENDPDAPGWIPDETVVLDPCPSFCTSLFWVVPANVTGTWRLVDQERTPNLNWLRSSRWCQAACAGTVARRMSTRVGCAGEISFRIGNTSYRGRADDATMTGIMRTNDGTAEWRASRVR